MEQPILNLPTTGSTSTLSRPNLPSDNESQRGRISTSTGGSGQSQVRDPSLDGYTVQRNGSKLNNDKNLKPKTGTSHVVCKFFKQGSCTAGSACPFSHDNATPGSKPICQWYTTGNCKFGHKCALAHLLPGQPMSYDRKNKRAAQAALREAQGGLPTPLSPRPQHQLPPQQQQQQQHQMGSISGIGRSLGNNGTKVQSSVNGNLENRPLAPASPQMNGSPRLAPNRISPTMKPNSIPLQTSKPPTIVEGLAITSSSPSFESTLSRPTVQSKIAPSYAYPNPNTNPPPPSGLSQTLNPQFSSKGGNLAHVMLGQHGRRLSNNNQSNHSNSNNASIVSSSLSPPRMTPRKISGYTTSELLEASPSGSSPLALPAALPSTGGHGIFGTSPFSGSRSLFMPSSYDSSDGDAFGRSPPGGSRGLEEMRRSNSNSGWDRPAMLGFDANDSAVGDEEESDDEYEEGFLPSSLNDLLTPEEQRRRGSRIAAGFNPFQNHSVPADLMLSSRPIPTTSTTLLSPQPQSRSLLSNSNFSINSPPRSSDFLSISPHNAHLYSSSYDPASARYQPQQNASSLLSNYFSPTSAANSVLPPLSPQMGSSLPGELAAGLSHLHLTPASYTGDTPVQSFLGPPSVGSTGAGGVGRGSLGAWGSGTSPSSWGSSVDQQQKGLGVPSNRGVGMTNSTSSPLHQVNLGGGMEERAGGGGGSGDDDEIQFDMDT